MNYEQVLLQSLAATNRLALATAVANVPNVRMVNFCYDEKRPDILYFASDRGNRKVFEFTENDKVSFTTIPHEGVVHVRSSNAVVKKSELPLSEVKDLFVARVPGYDQTLDAIGESLDVFEIHIKEVLVIADFENAGTVSFR